MVDVCAARQKYTPPSAPRHPTTERSADGIVRAVLGRVDASLWTLRALGAVAHVDELRRSLRDLLAVDEARHG